MGFTAAAHALDPEDLRRTQSEFFERVRAVVTAFGGTVEKYVGDAVLALFGAPVAHENDPYRGVRAGLEVQRGLEGLALSDGSPVRARVGVATGEALVALEPGRSEALVTGDVMALAAALQAAAPPGGVLVGPVAHRVTATTIRYEEADAVLLPGRSVPVETWRAVAVQARSDDVVDPQPIVGREPEVALVTGALQRVLQEGRAQLVTLVGDPGLGKSRLVRAVKEFVDSPSTPQLVRWRSGHCLPYGDGVAFWALSQLVKAQAGILETDSATVARLRLETSARSLLGRSLDPAGVEAVVSRLAALLGLPEEAAASEESHAAWLRFLVALAEDNPTVLVLEDLHWADEALLGFVLELVDAAADVPLLVLVTARPELLDRRPDWTSATRDALTLTLAPLSERDTTLVLARLLGQAVLPDALHERLLDRVGGNPLYAEEYVRMLADSGVLERSGPEGRMALGRSSAPGGSDLGALPLPDSVQGVVDSRLDLLSTTERAVVSAAAVVGEVFWEGAVAAVADTSRELVLETLAQLEAREVVRRAPSSTVEGETEWAFRHVLVRDAAYHRIPRVVRLGLHERCAEWLERLRAHRGDDVVELLAHHRALAYELAAVLGSPTEDYARAAREALTTAAERALRLRSVASAHALASRAVMLWHGTDDDPDQWRAVLFAEEIAFLHAEQDFHDSGGPARIAAAGDALLALGQVAEAARAETLLGRIEWFRAEELEARLHVTRALSLLADEPDSEQKAGALVELARIDMLAHRLEGAADAAERAADMARSLGLLEIEANALITLGCAHYLGGDEKGLVEQEDALAFCREHRLRATGRALNNLAASLQEEGQLRRSYALLEQVEAQAPGFGLSLTSSAASADRALQAFYDGDWALTLELASAVLDDGAAHWEVHLRVLREWLRLLRDEPVSPDLDAALRTVRHGGFPQLVRPVLALASACRVMERRHDEAADLFDDLLAHWDEHGIGGGAREWLPATVFVATGLVPRDGGSRLRLVEQRLLDAPRATLWVQAALASARAAMRFAEGRHADALEEAGSAMGLYDRIGDRSVHGMLAPSAARVAEAAGRDDLAEAWRREAVDFATRNGAGRVLRWAGAAQGSSASPVSSA